MSHGQRLSRDEAIERIEELEAENDRLREDVDKAWSVARDAHDEALEHREQLADLREEFQATVADLREEIDELRDRTDLMAVVEDAAAADRDTKAAMCIQILAEDTPEGERREMTAREGWNALHRATDRTNMYDVYRRAESLVDAALGEDQAVVYFEKRSGQTPSVLVVDRSAGHLPGKYDGRNDR